MWLDIAACLVAAVVIFNLGWFASALTRVNGDHRW